MTLEDNGLFDGVEHLWDSMGHVCDGTMEPLSDFIRDISGILWTIYGHLLDLWDLSGAGVSWELTNKSVPLGGHHRPELGATLALDDFDWYDPQASCGFKQESHTTIDDITIIITY